MRHENLTSEELALQADLDRSWAGAQKALADPSFRAYLEQSIENILGAPPAPRLSREEFLAQTELPPE